MTLNDDCLWHIMGFLDPLNWASMAQVCTRWERVAQSKFKKIKSVYLKDPLRCKLIHKQLARTNAQTVKSTLKYLGPHLQSVNLGDCNFNTIYFGSDFGYEITDGKLDPEFWISMFEHSTNLVELQIGKNYIESRKISRQILKSNKNLKTVVLPDSSMMTFPRYTFDSVEEVVWEVNTIHNYWSFVWVCAKKILNDFKNLSELIDGNSFDICISFQPFPNVEKLTLIVKVKRTDVEKLVHLILNNVKRLKYIAVVINPNFQTWQFFSLLKDISNLVHLEELHIITESMIITDYSVFEKSSIKTLIKKCQKLRVVKFDGTSLDRNFDASDFLVLPELEELMIRGARVFTSKFLSQIESNKIENLAKLVIQFVEPTFNWSGLCDGIERMPCLEYLHLSGLPKTESLKLTYKAIECGVLLGRNVIIFIKKGDSMIVSKSVTNSASTVKTEPMKVKIFRQGADYNVKINTFVESLENCSIARHADFKGVPYTEYRGRIPWPCPCFFQCRPL